MQKPEILAPAGSMETLCASLKSGADAVYIGGKKFSARNNAANFTDEEIADAVKLCHRYGAAIYIAVNTIISDSETDDFIEYIKYLCRIGTDGFIVQDWGAFSLIKTAVPDAVLHASTQMSVHTVSGAEYLRNNGFVRVVPSRECSKEVLEGICRLDVETEVFVHGALCMSVSGQCYMSAMMGARSANRGCCGQACRLPFSAVGNKSCSALSLKDLSLIPRIAELCETGIDSLKIEGRMKRPEYVASAVNELKKAIDGGNPDMKMLRGVFSRSGFTDGYFTGELRNMFGVREKEDVVSAHELIPQIHEIYRAERQVHSLSAHVEIKKNKPVSVVFECEGISVSVCGDIPAKAEKRAVDFEYAEKQISKLGDTVFSLVRFTADIDDGLFVPASKLNELRREATDKMTEALIAKHTPEYTVTDRRPELSDTVRPLKQEVRTYCRTLEQAVVSLKYSDFVILDSELCISDEIITSCSEIMSCTEKIIVSAPRFITDEGKVCKSLEKLRKLGFVHLLCHTPDSIALGKKFGFRLHGNYTLNIFNSYSVDYMEKSGLESVVFSVEGKISQLDRLKSGIPVGVIAYGNIPVMLTRNCPVKNEAGCGKCTGRITDRTGRNFPVLCHREYVEILNTDKLCMTDRLDEIKSAAFRLYMFSDENAEQTREIILGKKPDGNITRGLYYRGLQENI